MKKVIKKKYEVISEKDYKPNEIKKNTGPSVHVRREIDAIDMEAEREANAMRKIQSMSVKPRGSKSGSMMGKPTSALRK